MKIMEEENRLSQPKDKTAEEACLVLTKEAHGQYNIFFQNLNIIKTL